MAGHHFWPWGGRVTPIWPVLGWGATPRPDGSHPQGDFGWVWGWWIDFRKCMNWFRNMGSEQKWKRNMGFHELLIKNYERSKTTHRVFQKQNTGREAEDRFLSQPFVPLLHQGSKTVMSQWKLGENTYGNEKYREIMGFHGVKDCNGRKKKFMKIKRKQIFTVGSNRAIKRIRPIGGGFGVDLGVARTPIRSWGGSLPPNRPNAKWQNF